MKFFLFLSLTIFILIIIKNIHKFKPYKNKHSISDYFYIFLILCLVFCIIIFPKQSIQAATDGLYTWLNVVLPSLLPFLIISDILIGLGVVNFIGTLLRPVMFPVFRVPGEGAFPFVMSIISGYPVGIQLSSQLLAEKKVTPIEAQRIISFSSTSGPLFMIGAVSVGMLKNSSTGPLLALSHYLGAITVGILFRFYKYRRPLIYRIEKTSIRKALESLAQARKKDNRSIGQIMGDAVNKSFNTILMVGGFIIFYSVMIEILSLIHVIDYISALLTFLLPLNNSDIIKGIVSGFIEVTNGCEIISNITSVNLVTKISIISFIIGWSGLSIHSQAISILDKEKIKINLYIFSKFLHGFFAFLYTSVLYTFVFQDTITTFSASDYINNLEFSPNWLISLKFSIEIQFAMIFMLILIGLFISILSSPNSSKVYEDK